jgi:PPM family protein phosphatase
VFAAHQAILRVQQREPQLHGLGTTAVVLLSDYETFLCAHIGDSRLYYFQDGQLRFQTRDHSVPQALADLGQITAAEIRHHPDRNRLSRALTAQDEPRPDIESEPHVLHSNDAFLLCVDGFWEYVLEEEMEATLAQESDPQAWLARMESLIQQRAKENHDNYTAIAVMTSQA